MKIEPKIYLWVVGKGWEEFNLSDKKELESRGIFIHDRASIGEGARIGEGASIGDGARIGFGARIGEGASIGFGASIGHGASIGDGARIGFGARIGEGASIEDRASIGFGARIGDNITTKIIGINGSKHFVNYWGEDAIQIGCKKHTIQKWVDNFEKVGKGQNYTTEQIAEYGGYIKMIVELHKTWAL